jgi:putative membrane protein
METRRKTSITLIALGLAGAGLFLYLLLRHSIGATLEAVSAARWWVVAIIGFHLVPLTCDAAAWRALFPVIRRPRLKQILWMRWVGEAVSTLLPAMQVGGDLVRARLAASRGVTLSLAAATVLGDITLSIFCQIAFTVSGVALLAWQTGRSGLVGPTIAGSMIAVLLVGGFLAVQRYGIVRLTTSIASRLARSVDWRKLVERGEALDRDVQTLYHTPRSLIASAACTIASWCLGACEVWIALYALHVHATYARAFALESVGQGVRSAMFLVPGALGLQEGGYVVVGGLLGIPPQSALALALIRRVRELAVGVPGLIAWPLFEGHGLWSNRRIAHAH